MTWKSAGERSKRVNTAETAASRWARTRARRLNTPTGAKSRSGRLVRGVEVVVASPDGGKVVVDGLSDPRDPSRWSAGDLISMGFLNTPELVTLLDETPAVGELDLTRHDAILIAGGQSPMFTYRGHTG